MCVRTVLVLVCWMALHHNFMQLLPVNPSVKESRKVHEDHSRASLLILNWSGG